MLKRPGVAFDGCLIIFLVGISLTVIFAVLAAPIANVFSHILAGF